MIPEVDRIWNQDLFGLNPIFYVCIYIYLYTHIYIYILCIYIYITYSYISQHLVDLSIFSMEYSHSIPFF